MTTGRHWHRLFLFLAMSGWDRYCVHIAPSRRRRQTRADSGSESGEEASGLGGWPESTASASCMPVWCAIDVVSFRSVLSIVSRRGAPPGLTGWSSVSVGLTEGQRATLQWPLAGATSQLRTRGSSSAWRFSPSDHDVAVSFGVARIDHPHRPTRVPCGFGLVVGKTKC